ncbi:MAG: PCMD domain-containing protein [Bacteroidales bacterium]|jgi:hypothetical protein|nr:PCMD domain-containing protein [Bacteroidales bacterium]
MKYRGLILALLILSHLAGCVKVASLDDRASIASCLITDVSPEAVIFNEPQVEEGSIILPMDYGKYEFPVTVTLNIKTAQAIDKILGLDTDNTLVFENPETVRKIHLIALSGVVHSYDIRIEVAPRSDLAAVTAARLTEYNPGDFPLAREVVVDVVENEIGIFALKGAFLPLTVGLEFDLSPGAKLESPGNRGNFTINAYDTAIPFTIVAESGKKELWHIRLIGVILAENASQTDREPWERMAPGGALEISFNPAEVECVGISEDLQTSRYKVSVRDNGNPFPWKAVAGFKMNPYVVPIHHDAGQEFTIQSWEDKRTFYLVDILSRQARAWELVWQQWLNPANLVESFVIGEYTSQNNQIRLGEPRIDTLNSLVEIPMVEGNDFPLQITSRQVTLSEGATCDLATILTFESYRTEVPFSVTSQSGNRRDWIMRLDPWFETEARILSFVVDSYSSRENLVTLESNTATIDQDSRTVTLVLKSGYDFPLVLNAFSMELSPKATLQEAFPEGILFPSIDDIMPLTIMAESGDVAEWKLQLADERTENLEALVTDYSITGYQGTSQTEHNITLLEEGVVDTLNHTVTLVISDWSSKMPLTVDGVLNVSKNAVLGGEITTRQHRVVFNSTGLKFRFSVTSESGTNTTSWTLQLEDRSPVRSSEAAVTDFITGSPSSGYEFDQKFLEPADNLITLLIGTRPAEETQLTIKPRITVSEGARLSGITSGAPLSLSFTEPFTFKVMAEDETIRQWQIRLIYAPQVPNSGFEEWGYVGDAKFLNVLPSNGKGWTTGNNFQVIGSTRVPGKNSPYAVQMLTQLKTVDLVVMKVTSLAAGALLLGSFNFSMDVEAVMNPSVMTDFGIPFAPGSNPVGFEIDYLYEPGGQRVFTESYKGMFGMPAFKDPVKVDGPDKAVITAELHHNATGTWEYDLNKRQDMIAENEIATTGTQGWRHEQLVFKPVPGRENLQMTHLVVRMSSSWEGAEFKGADGSKLTVDNFKLIYYLPGPTAIILE